MLTIYRRHLKSCPHASRSYRRCGYAPWVKARQEQLESGRHEELAQPQPGSILLPAERYVILRAGFGGRPVITIAPSDSAPATL
jgi:hypothetical protein